MQGKKTHEQQVRTFERKDDVPKPGEPRAAGGAQAVSHPEARQSEYAVSRGGMNQESRDHNKHNKGGQEGHKPQRHGQAEEKS